MGMIRVNTKWWMLLSALWIFASCREEFEMDIDPAYSDPTLVVEGFVNVGSPYSEFKLSYTRPLNQTGESTVPGQASVVLEAENGAAYHSILSTNQTYVINHQALSHEQKYRLVIEADGQRYESEFVDVKSSPEITALTWEQNDKGVNVLVSTEDPTQMSRYYRWEYEETWRYGAAFVSSIILDNNEVRYRNLDELIHLCYQSERSSAILIATSKDLAVDAIHRFPVLLIPNLSEKLSHRYSVLVRQIPVTESAFRYWEQVRESSENLGDLFAPLPSDIQSNFACVTDPNRSVIGWAEVAKVSEKRIFIDRNDTVEFWPHQDEFYSSCMIVEESIHQALIDVRNNPGFLLVNEVMNNPASPDPTHYSYSSRKCVDCRVKGGVLERPQYWIDR